MAPQESNYFTFIQNPFSFGYSDKKAMRDHVPVGVYGNGFKSGSMRLGKDAIVFTKTRDSMSIGLLSQSYLQAIKAQQIMVPILTFRRDEQNLYPSVVLHKHNVHWNYSRMTKKGISETICYL